jgi:hypothetical protein
MSRNVIVDPSFWSDRASYLRDSGVAMYEQDWMNDLAAPEANLTDAAAFLGGMASSMQGQGLTVQYCSPLSGDELASVDYGNVTTTRVSVDRFTRAHWDAFLYDSRLAAAVELRPFTDVMMSTETDNLLLATLSTGPVGVGDAAGGVDARNLRRVARADGVIVKPDAPLLPTDAMYVADTTSSGSPMVATTSTVDGALRALYVVEYPRGGAQTASFSPAALGLGGRVFVYDWLTGSGSPEHGPTVTRAVTSTRYLVVVPIGPSGIGFVGDVDQFVTLGKQRVEHVSDDGALHATVLFAAGESSVTVGGFAPHRPDASASDGRITSLTYDASTQQFRAVLAPGDDHRAAVSFSGR